ncbi:YdeI/OmpD-associated family protein [Oerskovia sp. M15]
MIEDPVAYSVNIHLNRCSGNEFGWNGYSDYLAARNTSHARRTNKTPPGDRPPAPWHSGRMVTDRRVDAPRFHPETAAEWRAWLVEHHDDEVPGVWVVQWRRSSGRAPIDYDALIEEALSFGWIDGTVQTVDDERSMMWLTRRRPGSRWTRLSKERVARIEADGRMAEAGRAVIEDARADGSWTRYDDAEALVVPDDLAAALATVPPARTHWDGFPPGVRRLILGWIAEARRPQTRAARIEETAQKAALGERAHQQVR